MPATKGHPRRNRLTRGTLDAYIFRKRCSLDAIRREQIRAKNTQAEVITLLRMADLEDLAKHFGLDDEPGADK